MCQRYVLTLRRTFTPQYIKHLPKRICPCVYNICPALAITIAIDSTHTSRYYNRDLHHVIILSTIMAIRPRCKALTLAAPPSLLGNGLLSCYWQRSSTAWKIWWVNICSIMSTHRHVDLIDGRNDSMHMRINVTDQLKTSTKCPSRPSTRGYCTQQLAC